MQDIEGRKAIVLIASGIDTLSKLTFDKARRALQDAGVPIYTIGLMQSLREMADASGAMGTMERLDFLQADNEMRTFAAETGGMSYFPRFDAEFPGIFQTSSRLSAAITCLPTIHRIRRGMESAAHQSGADQSGNQRAGAHQRRQRQGHQVQDRREDRLHRPREVE